MKKNTRFDTDAPAVLHTKLDRAWLVREDEGSVSHSTTVRDPDNPGTNYFVTIAISRAY